MRRNRVHRLFANTWLVALLITALSWPASGSLAAAPPEKGWLEKGRLESAQLQSAPSAHAPSSIPSVPSAPSDTQFAQLEPGEPLLPSLPAKAGARNVHANRVVRNETDPTSTAQFSYIIQLKAAPLATYRGGQPDLPATSPAATGSRHLDLRSAASVAYRAWLAGRRGEFRRRAEAALGRPLRVVHEFDTVFNGLSLLITPREAARLLALEEVLSVQRDGLRFPTTDDSPAFLGVPAIWDGSATGELPGTRGEGVIVGVIDTGAWPEHPSFADDGTLPPPPAKWQGACVQPQDNSPVYACNNKLIGMRYFLQTYDSVSGYDGLFFSARDDSGHGTHTASTAAGNANIPVSLYGIDRGTVSGMAPRAHLAVYKGLGPRGGYTSDLVAAIEAAVADGVDVINYSVGGGTSDPWSDADAQAYLAARAAGVFVVTSAGNGGPGPATIGSPANAPWVVSAGASYSNRLYLSDVMVTGPGVELPAFVGATSTAGVTDLRVIDAAEVRNGNGQRKAVCDAPFPPGSFQPTDAVICQRGGNIPSWAMADFVAAGGAGAALLYNGKNAHDFNTYLYALPTVNLMHETGVTIKEYVAEHPGQVQISFSRGEKVYAPDARIPADTVVGFSARGPGVSQRPVDILNVLKPDLVAPGIHVLAGASPQHVTFLNDAVSSYGGQNELFQLIQGTSMSSPHVAGVGALLRALHPDWTPAEIQSALMTTAQPNLQARDDTGDHAATPFDMGAGRIDPVGAAGAALLLDETPLAYAAADPARGGDPAALNVASLTDAYCVGTCRWTRTVRSSASVPIDWFTSTDASDRLIVQPARFTLQPGEEQLLTITANVAGLRINEWLFGQVFLTPDSELDPPVPAARLPVAVRTYPGRLPEELTVETRRNAAQYTLQNLITVPAAQLAVNAYAAQPERTTHALAVDPTPEQAYDFETGGLFSTTVDLPGDVKRFVVQTGESTAGDLDLFVGRDRNGNGIPEADEALCASTSNTADELCDFPEPGDTLEPDTYWIVVQNWTGSGDELDTFTLSVLVVDESDTGLIDGAGPPSTELNTPYNVTIAWDFAQFEPGQRVFGALEIADAATDSVLGSMLLTLHRLADDVQLTRAGADAVRPGDTVTHTIDVQLEPTVASAMARYILTDTLPAGMSYVAGSATVPPTRIQGQQLIWEIALPTAPGYQISTNATDPLCDTGYGGYVHLADFDILPQPSVSGNATTFRFDDLFMSDAPVTFYGGTYTDGMYFTDDGFATFAPTTGTNPGVNQNLPDASAPNAVLAPFWRDLEIVYDADANRGVSIAGTESGLMLVEYVGVEPAPAGSTEDRYTFELIMSRTVREEPGAYEIVFAYDEMNGPFSTFTTGIENGDGSVATQYAYNNTTIPPGLILCFDWDVAQEAITYRATVDSELAVPATLATVLEHTIDAPGYRTESTQTVLEVPAYTLDVGMDGPALVLPGEPITYTLAITNYGPDVAPALVAEMPLPAATELIGPGRVISGVIRVDVGDVPSDTVRTVDVGVRPLGPDAAGQPTRAAAAQSPSAPEIVGGVEAEPGAWPWQVAIMYADRSDGYQAQFCGGTLIATNWVLTAAHCVADRQGTPAPPTRFDVAVGRHTLSADEGQRIPVSQIVVHPSFEQRDAGIESDVALLRLARHATASDSMAPIALLSPALADLAAPDTIGIIIGWGARTDPAAGAPDYADALQQATVPVVANETCAVHYDDLYLAEGIITENMLCAGFAAGGVDTCLGDSGGPLIVPDGDGSWLQAGITSWGEGCGQPGYYGVYARVANFYTWLTGEGQNTYSTVGPFRIIDPQGQQVEGFERIVTVVDVGLSEVNLPAVVVRPETGGELVTTLDNMAVSLRVPAGAVDQTLVLGLESTPGQNTPLGLNAVGTPFAMRVFDRAGTSVEAYEFGAPVELTIRLDNGVQGKNSPSGIQLHYFLDTEGQWQSLPATIDEQVTELIAAVARAGVYALFSGASGEPLDGQLYLPFIGN